MLLSDVLAIFLSMLHLPLFFWILCTTSSCPPFAMDNVCVPLLTQHYQYDRCYAGAGYLIFLLRQYWRSGKLYLLYAEFTGMHVFVQRMLPVLIPTSAMCLQFFWSMVRTLWCCISPIYVCHATIILCCDNFIPLDSTISTVAPHHSLGPYSGEKMFTFLFKKI